MLYKALTVAGSDSGGGAGIQADLKTFQELGVYGMSVITAVTAQNTQGVQGVFPLSVEAVESQLRSIEEDLRPDAVKIGMLQNASIIRAVAAAIRTYKWSRVVVDPVMIAKGGASLLQQEAIKELTDTLLPLAEVVTPNIPEAEALTGIAIHGASKLREAAVRIHSFGPKHVIIKGGHSADNGEAADLHYDGRSFTEYYAPRIPTANTHGTGCTFSSALSAGLAQGLPIEKAIFKARSFIQAAILHSLAIGSGHGPTNHWAYNRLAGRVQSPSLEVKIRRLNI